MRAYEAKQTKKWIALSLKIRTERGNRCERCHHANEKPKWVLTVHHWDGDGKNCNSNNLVALCQSCHLKIKSLFQNACGMHEFWNMLNKKDKEEVAIGVDTGWYKKGRMI